MSRFLRVRLLLLAAALVFSAAAAADTFGQSSGMVANVSDSASPNNTASSKSPSRTTPVVKSPATVGNFPVIVPSGLNGGSETNKAANKASDKAADKSSADGDSAGGDNATPPSPAPQDGVAALSGRPVSLHRNGPQQSTLTGTNLVDQD